MVVVSASLLDVRLPSRAMHYSAVWSEAWTWISENINITSRVDGQDKTCPEEKLYSKRLRKQLLPFLMPGPRNRGSGPKWAGKADPCFYLNGGNGHASDCDKVMLESGIASYTTNATFAYRRAPFVGQQVTFGNRSSVPLRRLRPPRQWEGVEPAIWLVIRGKATPSPLSLRHRPNLRRGGETSAFCQVTRGAGRASGGASPLPSLPPVAPSTEGGDTGVLRSQPEVVTSTPAPPPPTAASPAADVLSDPDFEEWLESDRLDIPAQQDSPRSQPRCHTVTPAVTRSAA